MKQLISKLILLTTIILFINSCGEKRPKTPEIMPLNLGNKWTFLYTSFNGKDTTNSPVFYYIDRIVKYNNLSYYNLVDIIYNDNDTTRQLHINNEDGLYTLNENQIKGPKGELNLDLKPTMYLKYPCKVGDKFLQFKDTVKVTSINDPIVINGRTFNCIKYEKYGMEERQNFYINVQKIFRYCPGVGPVCIEVNKKFLNEEKYHFVWQLLLTKLELNQE